MTDFTKEFMKKQAFRNGSVKDEILPIKSSREKLVERLERTTSILDFYKHKRKIIEHLRETHK